MDAKRPREKVAVPEPPGCMISNAYDIDERTALDAKRPREKVAVPEPPGCRVSSAYDIDERVTAVIPEITYLIKKSFNNLQV